MHAALIYVFIMSLENVIYTVKYLILQTRCLSSRLNIESGGKHYVSA